MGKYFLIRTVIKKLVKSNKVQISSLIAIKLVAHLNFVELKIIFQSFDKHSIKSLCGDLQTRSLSKMSYEICREVVRKYIIAVTVNIA